MISSVCGNYIREAAEKKVGAVPLRLLPPPPPELNGNRIFFFLFTSLTDNFYSHNFWTIRVIFWGKYLYIVVIVFNKYLERNWNNFKSFYWYFWYKDPYKWGKFTVFFHERSWFKKSKFFYVFSSYRLMQSDGNSSYGDVVSDNFNKESRDEDIIPDLKWKKEKICSEF